MSEASSTAGGAPAGAVPPGLTGPIPTVEELLGGFLVELCLSLILYGITVAQAYVYYLTYPDDGKLVRSLIGAVIVLESLHTATTMHMAYHYTITEFGNLLGVGNIVWSTGVCAMSGMLIVLLVQGFYVRRVWILSRNNIFLTAALAFGVVVRVSFGMATSVLTWTLGTWPEFRSKVGPHITLTTGLSLAATVDLAIALVLMYYLRAGKTGFQPTDRLIQSLMAYSVNTGAIIMVISIVILVTFLVLKDSLVFIGLVQVSNKLYANSLLGTLNARGVLRNKMSNQYDSSGMNTQPLSNIRFPSQGVVPTAPVQLQTMQSGKNIEIYQQTSMITDSKISEHGHNISDAKYGSLA
ncbi:hypothetical protein K474DRAFT_1677880 [Panus rudis PR-1116 ss-1]|nr:hypothetical protein K474DRAFT_1677880 [Panus rudis PR-1116 ss-1]